MEGDSYESKQSQSQESNNYMHKRYSHYSDYHSQLCADVAHFVYLHAEICYKFSRPCAEVVAW